MTTINTTDDLIQLVRENEGFRAALRRELLTEELLALPTQFAAMSETQSEMLRTQNQMLKDIANLCNTQNQMLKDIADLRKTQNQMLKDIADLRKTQNQMLKDIADLRKTQNQMLKDIADLRKTQNQMLKTQNEILQELANLRNKQNEMLQTQNDMLLVQANIVETQGAILRRLDNIEAHNSRLSHDFRNFRGNYAETVASKNAFSIALRLSEAKALGIDETTLRILSADDLRSLARQYGSKRIAALPIGVRESFYGCDLAMEVENADGAVCYIVAEASYTCDDRDTTRALNNADLLRKFTGNQAFAAVAGVRMDRSVRPPVDSGDVFWYQLEDDAMGPEEPN